MSAWTIRDVEPAKSRSRVGAEIHRMHARREDGGRAALSFRGGVADNMTTPPSSAILLEVQMLLVLRGKKMAPQSFCQQQKKMRPRLQNIDIRKSQKKGIECGLKYNKSRSIAIRQIGQI